MSGLFIKLPQTPQEWEMHDFRWVGVMALAAVVSGMGVQVGLQDDEGLLKSAKAVAESAGCLVLHLESGPLTTHP